MTTPTARFPRRAVALLTLLLLLCSPAISLAQADVAAGLASVKVASSMRPELDVRPGETRTERLTIRNDGTAPALVGLSQADLRFVEGGGLAYEGAGTLPASNADWIEVASQVEVPAGGSVDVPFTIQVPSDPALQGTYWSLLMVEPVDPEVFTDEAGEDAQVRTSVEVSFQYAVTVLTHIGTPTDPTLLFEDPQFREPENDTDDEHALALTLRNPGAHLLSADLWLELYDEQGTLVERLEGGEKRVYPGASLRHEFALGELAGERYQAVVIADAGGDDVFGVRYTLDAARP